MTDGRAHQFREARLGDLTKREDDRGTEIVKGSVYDPAVFLGRPSRRWGPNSDPASVPKPLGAPG
jgi:hypothetical protein